MGALYATSAGRAAAIMTAAIISHAVFSILILLSSGADLALFISQRQE